MKRNLSAMILAFLLTVAALPASAEVVLSLNDPAGPEIVNDQPASVTAGSTTHVAWIGGASATGPFRLYYGAYNSASDFTNLALTRDTASFFRIPPTPFPGLTDNTGSGNAFADVRHPWIGVSGGNRVVILFQGKASVSDTAWGLYRATFLVGNSAIVGNVSVKRILGGPGDGDATFPSAALYGTDGWLRTAYSFFPEGSVSARREVRYARVGIENNVLTSRSPVTLSTAGDLVTAETRGYLPLPSIGVDPSGRAHVAWVSEDNVSGTSGVWYAMVAVTNGSDNVQIAGTNVIGRNRSWSRPHALPYEDTRVYVTAWDNEFSPRSGSVAVVQVNPNGALLDGRPVNLGDNRNFLLQPPGVEILPSSFDLCSPTATVDLGGRIFLLGYGSDTSPLTYLVANPLTSPTSMVTTPTPAAFGPAGFATTLPDDVTFPALAFYSDRAFLFWSGYDNVSADRRNVNVTSVFTAKQWEKVNESGCSASGGTADGLLAAAALLLPALRLLLGRTGRQGGEA